jgi:hypothetical protein
MKELLLILVLAVMCSSVARAELSYPYEGISGTGYGKDWSSTEENEYNFNGLPQTRGKKFRLGSGDCERRLKSIYPKSVIKYMGAINLASKIEGNDDTAIAYSKLQCVAYYGIDEECKANRLEEAKRIKNSRLLSLFMLRTWLRCDVQKNVGEPRTFSFSDVPGYHYVPNAADIEWINIGTFGILETLYVNASSLTKSRKGNLIYLMIMTDSNIADENGALSTKQEFQFDCKKREWDMLSFTTYPKHMGRGKQIHHASSSGSWFWLMDVQPNTRIEKYFNYVCGK